MAYASWGLCPMFWPLLRSSTRAQTIIKAARGTVAAKGVFDNFTGGSRLRGHRFPLSGPSVPLSGPSVPLTGGIRSPHGPLFNCLIQSRKCAINNFWTKNPWGLLGWGSRGSRQIIYVRISPNIWSVFGTGNRPNINNFQDRQPA